MILRGFGEESLIIRGLDIIEEYELEEQVIFKSQRKIYTSTKLKHAKTVGRTKSTKLKLDIKEMSGITEITDLTSSVEKYEIQSHFPSMQKIKLKTTLKIL